MNNGTSRKVFYVEVGDDIDVEELRNKFLSDTGRDLVEDLKYYELVQAANAARLALAGSIDRQIAVDLLDDVLDEIGKKYE